jgi:hypothetical protein
MAPKKRLWLLCFSLKMTPTTFGKAPQEEPEPELEKSPTKHALSLKKKTNNKANVFRFVVETQQAQGAGPWAHG